MGNGCSLFKINKACLDADLNVLVGKEELRSQNEEVNNLENKEQNNNNLSPMKKKVSISSNGIKHINNIQENYSSLNALQIPENENNKKNNSRSNFTNLLQDLDFSFNKNEMDQNDLFNINYIRIKTSYNKDIFNYLNKIRTDPKSIINDIDILLSKRENSIDNKVQIESDETHENIILDDGGESLIETKDFLDKIKPIETEFNLNEEFLIDASEMEKYVDLTLDKKIEKLLKNKKKSIIDIYPKCHFFINFIKDKKIGLLYLLSQNEKKSKFRNIVFSNEYTEFNISWMREKKKIFIAFLCFA